MLGQVSRVASGPRDLCYKVIAGLCEPTEIRRFSWHGYISGRLVLPTWQAKHAFGILRLIVITFNVTQSQGLSLLGTFTCIKLTNLWTCNRISVSYDFDKFHCINLILKSYKSVLRQIWCYDVDIIRHMSVWWLPQTIRKLLVCSSYGEVISVWSVSIFYTETITSWNHYERLLIHVSLRCDK